VEVIRSLGLTEEISITVCNAIANSMIEFATIPQEWYVWYAQAKLDERAFGVLNQEWSKLLADELEWRSKYPKTNGAPWPTTESLIKTSKVLARSKIGKFFGALSAESNEAANILGELGDTSIDPTVILELAKHITALIRFENNPIGLTILGADWAGLNTHFEDIDFGLSKLRDIRHRAGKITGLNIEEIYISLIVKDPISVTQYVSACKHMRDASKGFLEKAANTTLQSLIETSRSKLSNLKAIKQLNLSIHFENSAASVANLLWAYRVREKHVAASEKLNASKGGIALSRTIRKPSDISDVQKAINWFQILSRCVLPNGVSNSLKSSHAVTIRADLSSVARDAKPPLEKRENAYQRLSQEYYFGYLFDLGWDTLRSELEALKKKQGEVRDHQQIRISENHLKQFGLTEFLDRAIVSGISPESLPDLLAFSAAEHRAQGAIRNSTTLARSGIDLTSRRKQFVERDKEKIVVDRKSLRASLATSKPPSGTNIGPKKHWTELALLQNELNKEKRFIPARTLLSKAGGAMQELLPCFMMSPLALAKFTAAESLEFDLLVIDEASQMRSEDALGGLLRSKQVVVVGDQKQLPPTDFFGRADGGSDSDTDDDLEDDESILENCRKTFRKVRRLNWHYRSKCESLIRFSNEHFYDKSLITFPAPIKQSFSIDLVRVNGQCQSRRNPLEAAAITEQAVAFMLDHCEMTEEVMPTIGVVAINSDQRDLIQEEFSRLTSGDLRIEKYIAKAKSRNEEFFIKNLENVQGDERDYIFISMTYGPDSNTSVMKQNFGPINRKQGHRRLNVLFSRARVWIGLFVSFGSEDVKPTEKSSEGVRALRNYLKYVEAKGQSLGTPTGLAADSDFEIEVSRRMEAKGYSTEPQVGVSGYRIDLAVLDPDRAGQFLAGIECDGAAYHSSRSARDRDRLREEVLRGLGWTIVRVWSTDWFHDPDSETEKLVKKLQELRGHEKVSVKSFRIFEPASQIVGTVIPESASPDLVLADIFTKARSGSNTSSHIENAGENLSGGKQNVEMPVLLPLDTRSELINLREGVIRSEVTDWTLQRSILRDAMIETFISQKMENAEDWFKKVPTYLRQATNPNEKKYLEEICRIVAQSGSKVHGKN
jgi:very-short-patch-repair endonuclease